MPENRKKSAVWVPLMVVGMMLNTLGIALTDIGAFRFVLMGVGLALLLASVLLTLRDARRNGETGS